MNTFKFRTSLRFFGKSFDPHELSTQLGIKATYEHKMGERRTTPKGAILNSVYDESYCLFDIASHPKDGLHEVLDRTTNSLFCHKDLFNSIRRCGDRIEIFVGWFSSGNSGEVLPYDLMAKLGELGIDLALDVYGSNSEIEEN
ncbi:DUF4279 domain-containing protein [Rhodanobacter sp. DHG33]|uniref:DUF4279 domain-containing protein n=1 Tax=Rhodanobacter sp. DHG33 TaxID=2775921 RepID=UPI0017818E4E|nr:DUF4279 domain-containing protein [Rhodanobacter sp. DHG33]MBD8900356.1 DUF4279 domain-containing protein [Rhodanobacter sp. DHG33]